MIENLTISISFSEVEEAHVGNYFHLSEMSGEFLIIQKPDNTFYFLCSNDCDIVGICQSFDWYIVWKGPPFRWYLSLFKAVLPTIHYYILYRTSIFECCFRQKEA